MNGLFQKLLQGISALALAVVFSSLAMAADTYTIDKNHSTIGFSVTHLMVSTVRGHFADYEGTISFNPNDPSALITNVTIQTASIDTQQPDRDKHLRSADFLDTENSPTITFKSKSAQKDGNAYLI